MVFDFKTLIAFPIIQSRQTQNNNGQPHTLRNEVIMIHNSLIEIKVLRGRIIEHTE